MTRRNRTGRFPIRISKRLLLSVGLLLLIPAYPTISVQWFLFREPIYQVPIETTQLIQIRQDAYGNGDYGARRSGGRKHRGLDILATMKKPVLAAKSGRAYVGKRKDGMGNYVIIQHPDGSKTRYGHLHSIKIFDGQPIRQGEIIGAVGKSGNAKHRLIQSHLHFEIWTPEGKTVDPIPQMALVVPDESS